MSKDSRQLTRWEVVVLQAVFPILLIGVALPFGLVMLLLGIDGKPASDAVSHGELFLAGGNTAFTSCLVFISARPDKAMAGLMVCISAFIGVVLPCYTAWAHIATARDHIDYSSGSALEYGLGAVIASLVLAVALVLYSFFSPAVSHPATGAS